MVGILARAPGCLPMHWMVGQALLLLLLLVVPASARLLWPPLVALWVAGIRLLRTRF